MTDYKVGDKVRIGDGPLYFTLDGERCNQYSTYCGDTATVTDGPHEGDYQVLTEDGDNVWLNAECFTVLPAFNVGDKVQVADEDLTFRWASARHSAVVNQSPFRGQVAVVTNGPNPMGNYVIQVGDNLAPIDPKHLSPVPDVTPVFETGDQVVVKDDAVTYRTVDGFFYHGGGFAGTTGTVVGAQDGNYLVRTDIGKDWIIHPRHLYKVVESGDDFDYTAVSDILTEVHELLSSDRAKDYGDPRANHEEIGRRWGTSAADVARQMADLKLAHLKHQPGHRDSVLDAISYLVLHLLFSDN